MTFTQQPHRMTSLALMTAFGLLALALLLPGRVTAHAADGHPARIHEGSCTATGRVTDHLTGVGATVSLEGTPIPEPTVVGEPTIRIDLSVTTITTLLDHLVGDPHAIVIYESDEAMDHVIACGNVSGVQTKDGDQLVWLAGQQESGTTGLARLYDEGGTATTVTIYLAEQEENAEPAEATPAA